VYRESVGSGWLVRVTRAELRTGGGETLEGAPNGNSPWGWLRHWFLGPQANESADRRRALRLPVRMPIWIYGWHDGEPFSESSETVNVCAVGGLIPITSGVRRLQKLILTNLQTNEEVTCRVARVERAPSGGLLAGLEFLQVGGRFWRTGVMGEDRARSNH